jgi:hypothetical protein
VCAHIGDDDGDDDDTMCQTSARDLVNIYVPVEWLKELNLVDTPGTNAIIRMHQQITEHFIPQSDMVS